MEMEVDGETEQQEDCRTWWTEENNNLIRTWKDSESSPDAGTRKQQCHSDLSHLLQKIQGLPPSPLTLPLELTVLYNMVIVHTDITGGRLLADHSVKVEDTLRRVLDALGLGHTVTSDLWEKILAADHSWEVTCALDRLVGLQCTLWLSDGRIHDAVGLFSILSNPDSQNWPQKDEDLLQLIQSWKVSPEEPETILTVQTTSHVKGVLHNAAALLLGVTAMSASDFPRAVFFLQEAAGSLCSSRVLAEIYVCLGCSFYKMMKPQVSLQYWKMALRTDFRCLSALYHSAVLYREVGDAECELDALALLYTALETSSADDSSRKTSLPLRTELIVRSPVLSSCIHTPSSCEVKYLMARHCLHNQSIGQAVEHYLELMSALQDGSGPQGLCPSPAPLPRIPVVYLEASAALLENKRFQDAITVCSEVLDSAGHLSAGVICIDDLREAESTSEQLNCILWASSAHLLQGEAQGMLGDHREAITDFTRCINLLTKVQCGNSDVSPGSADVAEYKVCGVLKAAAFLGRGHQFQQTGEDTKALMNAQLSLQTAPAFPGATSCLLAALCRLGRKKEAASRWRKLQSNKENLHQQWLLIRRELPLFLSAILQREDSTDPSVMKEMEDYVQSEENKVTSPDMEFMTIKT